MQALLAWDTAPELNFLPSVEFHAELAGAEWAAAKMEKYFPMNINFMLNLSPDPDGKVDENQAEVFRKTGQLAVFPKPLTELPDGWLRRK